MGAHGDAGPRPCQVGFAQDEQLLLHTDGVTEARDEDGHF
ncbi:SpoIIE family protein phosphatase [Streptomyces scabiei]